MACPPLQSVLNCPVLAGMLGAWYQSVIVPSMVIVRLISDCASARALCIFCRISPERWSSKTAYGSEKECETLRS